MSNLIAEISEQHARLRKLEGDLEALRSQLKPARKRIKIAREALDTMIGELASGQSSLPLFRTEEPQVGNGQPAAAESVPTTEADRQPVRIAPLEFASAKRKRKKETPS
jgi:outer membrane protein TolC